MPLVLIHKAAKASRRKVKSRAELQAERYEGRVKTAFRANIDGMLSDGQIKRMANAVRSSDVAGAVQLIPNEKDSRSNWAKMEGQFTDNYRAIIAQAGHEAVADAKLGFTFNIDQKDVVSWIDRRAGGLVADMSQAARDNIRDVIRRGALEGLTVDQQARLLRPMIGLTNQQADAVQNRYQLHLDAGMDEDRAAEMAGDYAHDLLDMRAETIARTETITAANQGKMASMNQARDEGLLGDNPTKKWVGSEFESSDYGACEDCARLNASDPIPLDALFDGGDHDDVDVPPLHPRCRCSWVLASAGFGDAA